MTGMSGYGWKLLELLGMADNGWKWLELLERMEQLEMAFNSWK